MKKTLVIVVLTFVLLINVDGKKISRSRSSSGSSRSTSRRTSYSQPAPTSLTNPQASAPKPSLFGWQERPATKTQTFQSRQGQTSSNQGHSYPSSNTGLSGNNQWKPNNQETIQRNNVPVQQTPSRTGSQTNNQMSHSYPVSNGMSGSSGGVGYPQQQGAGLSGANVAPPPYQSVNTANNNYKPQNYPTNNVGNSYHAQGPPPPYTNAGNNYHSAQGPPPPYSNVGIGNSYHPQVPPPSYNNFGHSYGGYGGHGSYGPGYGSQMPGYFGNYANKGYGGMSRTGSALTGVGIAGAGVGTILTGLALWNLARSTGHRQHTVIYDNRGQPVAVAPDNSTSPAVDPILADLVNCTLTISGENATEVLAIPCSIATSFTPDADIKDVNENNNGNDKTKCTITVVTKSAREFMTTIPCSILLNTAAENNVTEAPIPVNGTAIKDNSMAVPSDQPTALRLSDEDNVLNNTENLNCTPQPGDIRDPINPCFSVNHNLTVIPLQTTQKP